MPPQTWPALLYTGWLRHCYRDRQPQLGRTGSPVKGCHGSRYSPRPLTSSDRSIFDKKWTRSSFTGSSDLALLPSVSCSWRILCQQLHPRRAYAPATSSYGISSSLFVRKMGLVHGNSEIKDLLDRKSFQIFAPVAVFVRPVSHTRIQRTATCLARWMHVWTTATR